MFTGLIEKTGKLIAISECDDSASLTIECHGWGKALTEGESISVQGACLTVTSTSANHFNADLLKETLNKTTFASMKCGVFLNLERALKSSDRMGGHIVTGHVDGTGKVKSVSQIGRDWIVAIECESSMLTEIVKKGSISLNGVSLTVTECTDKFFAVNIIPFTWANTNLASLRIGDLVNIETDIIAKYVRKCQQTAGTSEVTLETLERAGFI